MRCLRTLSVCLVFLMLVGVAGASELSLEPRSQDRGGGVWRSLAFPGLGQIHQGRQTRGIVWSSGALVLGFSSFFTHMQYNSADKDYEYAEVGYRQALAEQDLESAEVFHAIMSEAQPKAQERLDRRNAVLIGLGIWWGANLVDAWLFERNDDSETQATLPGHLAPVWREGAAGVAWGFEF